MKYVRRDKCRETNSSSMHVFICVNNDMYETTDEIKEELFIKENKIIFGSTILNGYGRSPFEILQNFRQKLSYALCEYLGDCKYDSDEWNKNYNFILNAVKNVLPQITMIDLPKEYIYIYMDKHGNILNENKIQYKLYNGDNCETSYQYVYLDENNEWQYVRETGMVQEIPHVGEIDHQSAGRLNKFLTSKGITLTEFLTNKKYIICIDGDEYAILDTLMDIGLIDKSKIEDIVE